MTHLYPTIVASLDILYCFHGVIVFVIVAVTVVYHIIYNGQYDECKDDLSLILAFFELNSSAIERILDCVIDNGQGIVPHCQRIVCHRWMYSSFAMAHSHCVRTLVMRHRRTAHCWMIEYCFAHWIVYFVGDGIAIFILHRQCRDCIAIEMIGRAGLELFIQCLY